MFVTYYEDQNRDFKRLIWLFVWLNMHHFRFIFQNFSTDGLLQNPYTFWLGADRPFKTVSNPA